MKKHPALGVSACHLSRVTRHREKGIALVITLIMLAVTLVMAVAFLALARRERGSVTTTTDTTTARLAADTAVANAQAQIIANMLNGASNAYNLRLLVSTNYINPLGFNPVVGGNPTNVNYFDLNGNLLTGVNFQQMVSNLYYLPRAPVMISSNEPLGRFYLDLNQNRRFEANGWAPVLSGIPATPYYDNGGNLTNDPTVTATYIPSTIASIFNVGDPEWIGVLEHPDQPHGPNNHFIARYAFIALPVGNSLDINYIHNQVLAEKNANAVISFNASDAFFRNQGLGSWEINLAAFLADLNTNKWGQVIGTPANGNDTYYYYQYQPNVNHGFAFYDAQALLAYRYSNNYNTLASAFSLFANPANYPFNVDGYGDGPLQTTLNTNLLLGSDNLLRRWPGSDNTNHFFTPGDFFDVSKTALGISSPLVAAGNDFAGRLLAAGNANDTYNRYTYYRMLDQLGTDSSPEQGKLNLNYSNAVVGYNQNNGTVANVSIITGAETNLVPWTPQNFFHAAADQLLRTYSANWLNASYVSFTNSYAVTAPFGITNVPVWVSNRFVYTPAIHRLLQLAANLYDATTNGNNNLPHVFRPIFEKNLNGDIFIVGYTNVASVSGLGDQQLAPPYDITQLSAGGFPRNKPLLNGGVPINVYGVPWIIGAKKGLPNFNQFYLVNAAQVTRKLQVTRTTTDPATAVYATNQMYVIGISNNLGISFWNSYTTNYPRPLTVVASDAVYMSLSNGASSLNGYTNFYYNNTINSWPGAQWSGSPPTAQPQAVSFLNLNWTFNFLNPSAYRFNTGGFYPVGSPAGSTFETSASPTLPPLPQFNVVVTNYLQAYILDGNNVVDYVQLRDPLNIWNLNSALADGIYSGPPQARLQWSTNYPASTPPTWGVANQLIVSGDPTQAPNGQGGTPWSTAPTAMGETTPPAEAAFFNGFFVPSFYYVLANGKGANYQNLELSIQAPYTPTRTAYASYLLQANDPLVHYLASDLNAQTGAWAYWANLMKRQNGDYYRSDDSTKQPLPTAPANPIGGRYQPWLQTGQMDGLASVNPVIVNYAVKDPLLKFSDNWDFPTNPLPTVGWIGRVHRGTPWQTVYLKDADFIRPFTNPNGSTNYLGTNTWAQWTGDIQQDYFGRFFDAANSAPVQDRLLFDLFTTRFNDNSVRGTLPVNQTHLAAWSALFSGMVALTNNAPMVFALTSLSNNFLIINPAGVYSNTLSYSTWPPIAQIVNGPFYGINATRASFPNQAFTHAGDILATPALTKNSPFLNLGNSTGYGQQQMNYGISDELYEWLPQQMMGLVRLGEPRYVLYCYGQTLRPAPGGEVLSGPFFQLITNYQVAAESAVRAVVRVDRTNPGKPKAVVETYNALPPN